MFNSCDGIPTFNLVQGQTTEQIKKAVQDLFEDYICFKEVKIGLALSQQVVKTHYKLYCYGSTIANIKPPELNVVLNEDARILVNFDTIVELENLASWLSHHYPTKNKTDESRQEISLIWTADSPTDLIEAVVLKIIEGHELIYEQLAREQFSKSFCALNHSEFLVIEKMLPFKLKLGFGKINTPPPPPLLH